MTGSLKYMGAKFRCERRVREAFCAAVIEFDFQNVDECEIHAIAPVVDEGFSIQQYFQLYGTQDWGLNAIFDFNDYAVNAPQKIFYSIPVGKYYTGSLKYLGFVNDCDAGGSPSDSTWSNIRIYEAK